MAGFKRPRPEVETVEVDNIHPSRKRRLGYSKEDAQLAAIYNDLADDVHAVRLKAAFQLIAIINAKTPNKNERVEHALDRLIKGLCSGRKAARLGFSIALSEVLRVAFQLAIDNGTASFGLEAILDKVLRLTEVEHNASGQEKRDALIGRRFALHAILQSDVAASGNWTFDQWRFLLHSIAALASQKPWLRSECGAMLFEYLESPAGSKLNEDQVLILIDVLREQSLLKTPEGVALWLAVLKRVSKKKRLPKGIWEENDPLCSKERPTLKKILHGVVLEEEEATKTASGTRQSQPSFAWKVILSRLYPHAREFKSFWDDAVENGLFASSSSIERKYLGLQILSTAILTAPQELLMSVLSANIIRYIVKQRSETGKLLFEATKPVLHDITSRTKIEPDTAGSLVQCIIDAGFPNFDHVTKSKTLETLVHTANLEELNVIINHLRRRILATASEKKEAESQRRTIADLLLSIVRSRIAEHELAFDGSLRPWTLGALQILVDAGYAKSPQATPVMSKQSQELMKSRVTSCLGHLLNQSLMIAATGARQVAKMLVDLETSEAHALSPSAVQAVKSADKHLGMIAKEKKTAEINGNAARDAYQLLFGLAIIQVYDQEPDAIEVLQDLSNSFETRKDDASATTMIVEILLSFISKPSNVFRKLAEQVFTTFASEMTAESLQSLLDVLGQKEDMSGQHELFEQRGEHQHEQIEADGDLDIEDVEDASDVEMVNGEIVRNSNGDLDSDVESVTSSSSSNSTTSDGEEEEGSDTADDGTPDENEEALLALDQKLTEVLGTAAFDPDNDEASDSDADMTDTEMLALEPHLQKIFASHASQAHTRKSKKQQHAQAKANMIQFKNRVLDLLAIYVRKQYANVLTLELVLPLLEMMRETKSRPTAEKGFAVLKSWVEACARWKQLPLPVSNDDDDDEGEGEGEDDEDEGESDGEESVKRRPRTICFDILNGIMEEMRIGEGSKLHANACSRAALFVSKLLVTMDQTHYAKIADMYAQLQAEWYLDGKSNIQGSVFTEWTSWSLTTRKQQQQQK